MIFVLASSKHNDDKTTEISLSAPPVLAANAEGDPGPTTTKTHSDAIVMDNGASTRGRKQTGARTSNQIVAIPDAGATISPDADTTDMTSAPKATFAPQSEPAPPPPSYQRSEPSYGSSRTYAVPDVNGNQSVPSISYPNPNRNDAPFRSISLPHKAMTVAFVDEGQPGSGAAGSTSAGGGNGGGSSDVAPVPIGGDQQPQSAAPAPESNRSGDYLSSRVETPLTKYEIQANKYIPAVFTGSVNSNYPGQPTAMVSENVYDSIESRHLLIPATSTLKGSYQSVTAGGLNRIYIVWDRLFLPDGRYIDLLGFPATDQAGSSGVNARVDKHIGDLIGNTLLLTAVNAATAIGMRNQQSSGNNSNGNNNAPQTSGSAVGTVVSNQIANLTDQLTSQAIARAPELSISTGSRFNIAVLKDMVFPGAYERAVLTQ